MLLLCVHRFCNEFIYSSRSIDRHLSSATHNRIIHANTRGKGERLFDSYPMLCTSEKGRLVTTIRIIIISNRIESSCSARGGVYKRRKYEKFRSNKFNSDSCCTMLSAHPNSYRLRLERDIFNKVTVLISLKRFLNVFYQKKSHSFMAENCFCNGFKLKQFRWKNTNNSYNSLSYVSIEVADRWRQNCIRLH